MVSSNKDFQVQNTLIWRIPSWSRFAGVGVTTVMAITMIIPPTPVKLIHLSVDSGRCRGFSPAKSF